jgi:hypothetical protein
MLALYMKLREKVREETYKKGTKTKEKKWLNHFLLGRGHAKNLSEYLSQATLLGEVVSSICKSIGPVNKRRKRERAMA